MPEAWDRQKSITDTRHMKEMQSRMDSEHQVSLRKREEERERAEKKRQECTQKKYRPSSIQATRSCERAWITPMAVHKQSDVAGDPECTMQKSSATAPGITTEHKLPAINKKKEKRIQKLSLSSKTLGMQEQYPQHEPSDPLMEGSVQISKAEAKDDCQQRKNKSDHSSKPNVNTRAAFLQTYRSPNLSSAPVSPGANDFLSQKKSSESSRVSTRRVQSRFSPFRFRDEYFYSLLEQNTEDAPEGNKDIKDDQFEVENLSCTAEESPVILNKTDRLGRRSSKQIMHPSSGEEYGGIRIVSSDAAEPFNKPLTQMAASPEHCMLEGKTTTDLSDENSGLDGNNEMERETSFSPINANLQQYSDSTVAAEAFSTSQIIVDSTPPFCVHDEEWQANENPQGPSFASRARTPTHTPILISSYNLPRPLMPSTQRELVLNNPVGLELDMNGSPRTPFTLMGNRDSLTRVENQDSLSLVNQEPEASVRDPQNIMNSPEGPSPRGDLHGEIITSDSQRSSSTMNAPYPLALLNVASNHQLTGTLQEQLPFTLVTISDLQNQASVISTIAALTAASEKERNKPQADPEKLKKLQESLLDEESEEEGDLCRICQIAGGSPTNPLLEPCQCMGSLQFVHQECLKRWLKVKINSGAELVAVNTCELCKHSLKCDLDDFSVDEYYRKHQQSQAQNDLMDSGLYLVLLLHLYEQRYAELLRLSQSRTRRSLLFRTQPQVIAEDTESSEQGDGERYGNDNPNESI
uniref:RING-type E3 ubiquitin transferase n=1 Tax=Geotrypetes seraphini TaxID=260995 RepID=A0A6P8NRT7_GEOSA|nr:probable E3 ubiquitin-protein ligase MARCH10 isoform X2 [Geotrypetes seraphini]